MLFTVLGRITLDTIVAITIRGVVAVTLTTHDAIYINNEGAHAAGAAVRPSNIVQVGVCRCGGGGAPAVCSGTNFYRCIIDLLVAS